MGAKLSKSKKLLKCCKGPANFSPSIHCQQDAAKALSNVKRNSGDGILQLNEIMIDSYFAECLLELAEEQGQQKIRSVVFCDCIFNLCDARTVTALTEFLSIHDIKSIEFWDGEVPIEPSSLRVLLYIVSAATASSLERLKIEANLIGVGSSLADVILECSSLLHLELIGCTLDLEAVHDLTNGFHVNSRLDRVLLESCCDVTDEMLSVLLLQGLAKCPKLAHLHLSGNDLLTCKSLDVFTLFLRQCPDSQIQLSIYTNRHLFLDCSTDQARQFFQAYLKNDKNKDLFLCQTGMDNTAVTCLFQALEENQTVERLDVRYNSFGDDDSTSTIIINSDDDSLSWVDSLPKLQNLKTLHLPSGVQSSPFQDALLRNTSLTTCSYKASSYQDCRSKADIMTRNKVLDLVKCILASPNQINLPLYSRVMHKLSSRMSTKRDPTALFQMIRGKSTELACVQQGFVKENWI